MTLRYTDSNKFRDKWYMNLTPLQKCIWEYFVSECDHAGIYEVNLRLMSAQIGSEIKEEDIDFFVKQRKVFWITKDKLFIPNFVLFQQRIKSLTELNIKNRCHKSIIDELEKHDVWSLLDASKHLQSTLDGAKKGLNNDTILEKISPLEAPSKELVRGYSNSNSNISNITNNTKDNKKDIYSNTDFEKCFKIYSEICKDLIPLRFERRSKAIIELLHNFLDEIEYNFEYFTFVCMKANKLKTIMDTKIDFKMLLNNHAGIMNDKYKKSSKSVNDYKF